VITIVAERPLMIFGMDFVSYVTTPEAESKQFSTLGNTNGNRPLAYILEVEELLFKLKYGRINSNRKLQKL
jgi:hypothetical protein